MKWIEKWKESKEKQRKKDIEQCEQHPTGWKIMMWIFALAFGILIVFMIISGAIPLAVIAFVFAIWLERECYKIYRYAFPKIEQAFTGLT